MEKYLNKKTEESLNNLIDYIRNSYEYKECIRLKKEMSKDKELMNLIEKVKTCQRSYVRSNYSIDKKKELDDGMDLLNNNSLFVTYSFYLDKVNDMIKIIKDDLNNYFYEITNILN